MSTKEERSTRAIATLMVSYARIRSTAVATKNRRQTTTLSSEKAGEPSLLDAQEKGGRWRVYDGHVRSEMANIFLVCLHCLLVLAVVFADDRLSAVHAQGLSKIDHLLRVLMWTSAYVRSLDRCLPPCMPR